MISRIADSFRTIVSGHPGGRPAWVASIESAEGEDLFLPDSAVWQVHGSVATLIGGIRALLLQAAHPAALAGVLNHSRYEEDLLGRLQGTSRWLTITTFGTDQLVAREAARVNEMHKRVSGNYTRNEGDSAHYSAKDPRFLLWVHCAFTDSFLAAHKICKYPLTSADEYVEQWGKSAIPLGLTETPKSEQELKDAIQNFAETELRSDDDTQRVIKFILKPPFGFFSRLFYRPLAKAAVYSLSETELGLLALKRPTKFWVVIARLNLWLLKKALGKYSPAQEAAILRIAKKKSGDGEI